MPKKPKRKNLKGPGKCIFCGGGGMSREHFWPEWLHEYLPAVAANSHTISVHHRDEHSLREVKNTQRQGTVTVRRIKCVCKGCNNGWMSELEMQAAPIIIPLIEGKALKLTAEMQKVLVNWIALKIMVVEHSSEDYVTPKAARSAFMSSREIPAGFRIWIATHASHVWRSAAFYRQSATIGYTPVVDKPADGPIINVQTASFSLGPIFVHAMSTELAGFDLEKAIQVDRSIPRLWPFREEIQWPTPKVLVGNEPGYLATAFDRATQLAGVKWGSFR